MLIMMITGRKKNDDDGDGDGDDDLLSVVLSKRRKHQSGCRIHVDADF